MPLPAQACGQIYRVGAGVEVPGGPEISGNLIGSNSGWLALKCSTISVVSDRVKVQTEKINFPPGFTLGATWASKFF